VPPAIPVVGVIGVVGVPVDGGMVGGVVPVCGVVSPLSFCISVPRALATEFASVSATWASAMFDWRTTRLNWVS
jgi:hypothetical protein